YAVQGIILSSRYRGHATPSLTSWLLNDPCRRQIAVAPDCGASKKILIYSAYVGSYAFIYLCSNVPLVGILALHNVALNLLAFILIDLLVLPGHLSCFPCVLLQKVKRKKEFENTQIEFGFVVFRF
ncbi:MAG: hypothetical protein ACRC4H_15135, partial [Plesiomonas sp.]